MTLWIDADAMPRDIREIVFRTARRLTLATVLVANTSLSRLVRRHCLFLAC